MRVLVVEDEDLIRSMVVDDLVEAGFDVLQADSGDEALTYLDAAPPVDVLFTDIRMPGSTDGWQLAEKFRARDPRV
jgi:CheY-like chemotaxis protein